MAVVFRIFPSLNLVFVRYEGFLALEHTERAFARYAADPDFAPGQMQLVDLAAVTGWDRDYVAMMRLQAKKAEAFMGERGQTLVVFHAPAENLRGMAQAVVKSWDGIGDVVAMMASSEAEAMEMLGLPEVSFGDLREGRMPASPGKGQVR